MSAVRQDKRGRRKRREETINEQNRRESESEGL